MELMGWGWISKRWVWCVLGWENKRKKTRENKGKKRKIKEEMSVLGIHYVGQMEEGSLMRFLVDQLTDGQLEWSPLPATYDAVVLGDPQGTGKTFHIYSGKREYFQRLKEQFPGEVAAIDEFQRLVKVEADLGGIKRGEFGFGESHKEGKPLAPGYWAPTGNNGITPKGLGNTCEIVPFCLKNAASKVFWGRFLQRSSLRSWASSLRKLF